MSKRIWTYRDSFHYLQVTDVLPKQAIRAYTEYVRADVYAAVIAALQATTQALGEYTSTCEALDAGRAAIAQATDPQEAR